MGGQSVAPELIKVTTLARIFQARQVTGGLNGVWVLASRAGVALLRKMGPMGPAWPIGAYILVPAFPGEIWSSAGAALVSEGLRTLRTPHGPNLRNLALP